MENHPIPQDITGFQFKLIGDMTIKQFAYLATGVVSGWIIFSLPITSFIKLPISGIFILLGVGFAFFSLEGRPMDVMIMNFIRALFSPTQFVYQKTDARIETPRIIKMEESKTKIDEKETSLLSSFSQLFSHQGTIQKPSAYEPKQILTATFQDQQNQTPKPQPLEEPVEEVQVEELKVEEEKLKKELKKVKEEEEKDKGTALSESAHQKALELEKLLNETVFQKQQLEEELLNLRRRLEESGKQVFKVSEATEESQNVRSVPPSLGIAVGLPITSEYPNIVSGIIKDPRGNPLGNILVEVKDKEGNPVRAFKTNPLGQFSASTPLTNGVYRIEFEDPQSKNKFEVIEFEAKGDVILPIEVVSIDTREELRQELFK